VTTSGATRTVHAFSTSAVDVTFDLYRRILAVKPYTVTDETLSGRLGLIDFRGQGVIGRVHFSAECNGVGAADITFQ
jgi:hypothetical protein